MTMAASITHTHLTKLWISVVPEYRGKEDDGLGERHALTIVSREQHVTRGLLNGRELVGLLIANSWAIGRPTILIHLDPGGFLSA